VEPQYTEGNFEDSRVYGAEVSPTLISNVTDAVMDDVRAWQSRPVSAVYPILYFDALFVKTRQEGPVMTKAIYLALGINLEGEKELLGLWIAQTEGSKFWLTVFNDLKNRGLQDCFIACVDGLKGLPEAIEAVYPRTQVQLCIVHKLRNSFKYVPWKERKTVATDLRAIYAAATLAEAEHALARFSERWDAKYPAISPSWRADWQRLTAFFDYSPEIRITHCVSCSKPVGPFPTTTRLSRYFTWRSTGWQKSGPCQYEIGKQRSISSSSCLATGCRYEYQLHS
jgi:putative transposase